MIKQALERLKRVLHEHIGDVIIALSVIVVSLLAGRAYQRWSNIQELVEIKTAVELASVVLGIILGTIAAIAGYRRFFKGRTFSERAKVDLFCHPICEITEDKKGDHHHANQETGSLLHVVDLIVENIGSMTIWTPKVDIRARHLDSNAEFSTYGQPDKIETPVAALSISGIEPGERVHYHYRFLVPKSVVAFRVSAELTTSRSNVWHRAMTLKNGLSTRSAD